MIPRLSSTKVAGLGGVLAHVRDHHSVSCMVFPLRIIHLVSFGPSTTVKCDRLSESNTTGVPISL